MCGKKDGQKKYKKVEEDMRGVCQPNDVTKNCECLKKKSSKQLPFFLFSISTIKNCISNASFVV